MDAAEHDRVMAFVSHLPQLAASALMDIVGGAVAGRAGCAWPGAGSWTRRGWRRVRPSVWRDICATNADAIGGALDLLIDRLNDLRADLQRGETLEAVFGGAARWRGELMKDRD